MLFEGYNYKYSISKYPQKLMKFLKKIVTTQAFPIGNACDNIKTWS